MKNSIIILVISLAFTGCNGSDKSDRGADATRADSYAAEYVEWILSDDIGPMERQRRILEVKSKINRLESENETELADLIMQTLEHRLAERGQSVATIDF